AVHERAPRSRRDRAGVHEHAAVRRRHPPGDRPARVRHRLPDHDGARRAARLGRSAPSVIATAGSILATRGLTKRFGGVVAVDGLSLAVGEGEIRGLIGPNGSGKTTTVNLLSGLYRADDGAIVLRGERTERMRPPEIAARGVGRPFQVPKDLAHMAVL